MVVKMMDEGSPKCHDFSPMSDDSDGMKIK